MADPVLGDGGATQLDAEPGGFVPEASRLADLLLVRAPSVTRKPTPEYSRTLWHHLAVARAYEFGAYVEIGDWAYPSRLVRPTSRVGGFADPTTADPGELFRPIGGSGVGVFHVDFETLDAFRKDRVERGFFWTESRCGLIQREARRSSPLPRGMPRVRKCPSPHDRKHCRHRALGKLVMTLTGAG